AKEVLAVAGTDDAKACDLGALHHQVGGTCSHGLKMLSTLGARPTVIPPVYLEVMMLGTALRCIRKFHDLNQSEAAGRLGISKSYLMEIESGAKEASLQLIQRYADIFHLPPSSILFFAENYAQPGRRGAAQKIVAGKILALMRFLEARSEDAP